MDAIPKHSVPTRKATPANERTGGSANTPQRASMYPNDRRCRGIEITAKGTIRIGVHGQLRVVGGVRTRPGITVRVNCPGYAGESMT